MIVLVDYWQCTQCQYTEIRDIPSYDDTYEPSTPAPPCPECKRIGSRFGNSHIAPMETRVYIVEFGEPGYPMACANSRMRAVHDRIGYYPLPCESDTLVQDHIIFPDQNLAYRQKIPIPFPTVYCSSKNVIEPSLKDIEAPCPQSSVLSPEAIRSAKLPADMPPADEPPAVRDVSRSPAVLTSRALASCSDTASHVSDGNRSAAPSVISRASTSNSQR